MGFAEGDASGWDECLPSVAPCSVQIPGGTAQVPDHGDLWILPWRVVEKGSDHVTLSATCFSLPLEITRSVLIRETPTGWRLSLLYTLANRGTVPVPWSWAAHPLFVAQAGDRIHLPASIHTLRVEGSGDNVLGVNGDSVAWPIARLADGSSDDLSIAKAPASGRGDKLFTGLLTAEAGENWCALERPSIGLKLTFRFDPAATPYLGLWLCYSGWPDGDGLRQQCVALEPATAPVDSLAIAGPWSRTLAPGDTFSWPVELDLEHIHQKDEDSLA
jgi:galactose mutarotase-like enzyme